MKYALFVLTFLICSCDPINEEDLIDEKVLGDKVKEATELAAGKLSDAVVKAAGQLDPLSMKQILNENRSLEKKIAALKEASRKANAVPGVINLREGDLRLEVKMSRFEKSRFVILLYESDSDKKPVRLMDASLDPRNGDFSQEIVLGSRIAKPGKYKIKFARQRKAGFDIQISLYHMTPVNEAGQRVDFLSMNSGVNYEYEEIEEGMTLYSPEMSFNVIWK